MSGTYRTSFNTDRNSAETEIVGGSDGSLIGNIGDRLKVSTGGDALSTEVQGRVRVAENTVVFDAYFSTTDRGGLMQKKEVTGGTVTRDAGVSMMALSTTTASGSRAVYQSPYFHYVAGQTWTLTMTGVFGTTDTNCRKRMGYFDDNDGIYLEYDGTNLSFNVRDSTTGGSSQSVNSADFNEIVSFNFDPTKYYLWQISFLWQGGGSVALQCYVGGSWVKLHTFPHSGLISQPYMKTPNLPLRYEAVNVGTTSSAQTLYMACVQMSTEGRDRVGIQNRTASNIDAGGKSIGTSAFVPLVSVRLKAVDARAIIRLLASKVLATSQDDIAFRIIKNPTLTGASFASVGPNSVVEFDTTATALSGGVILDTGFVAKSGGTPSELVETFEVIQSDFDGTPDILTLCAKSLTSSATAYGALTWTELF